MHSIGHAGTLQCVASSSNAVWVYVRLNWQRLLTHHASQIWINYNLANYNQTAIAVTRTQFRLDYFYVFVVRSLKLCSVERVLSSTHLWSAWAGQLGGVGGTMSLPLLGPAGYRGYRGAVQWKWSLLLQQSLYSVLYKWLIFNSPDSSRHLPS